MLMQIKQPGGWDWEKMSALYEEENRELGSRNYPWLEPEAQLHRAEDTMFTYLREDFFPGHGVCAIWEENGAWISGLRIEPYGDGVLLTALTTRKEYRRRGYGLQLIRAVQALYDGPLYAHIQKRNSPSLQLHLKAGFQIHQDYAILLDGSVLTSYFTVKY